VLTFLPLTATFQPDIFPYECSAGNPHPSLDVIQSEDHFAAFDAKKFTRPQDREPNALLASSAACIADATLATLFAGQNCFDQATTPYSSGFQQPPVVTSNSPNTTQYATPLAVSFSHSRLQGELIRPI